MQLKPTFIQKEIPALVFSRQISKIFNNNFFKDRKKKNFYKKKSIVMRKKKDSYKKRRSVIYHKSNYATFYVTLPRLLYFRTVHSDNRLYIVLSVENK